ncbi:DciA family protein [Streptomyces sp. NRAIS4]
MADRAWEVPAAGGSVLDRWPEIAAAVAPQLPSHVVAVAFHPESGQLDLRPDSAAYATQLRLISARIVATVNSAVGTDAVRTVRVLPAGAGPESRTAQPDPAASRTPEAPVKAREMASVGYRQGLAAHQTAAPRAASMRRSRKRWSGRRGRCARSASRRFPSLTTLRSMSWPRSRRPASSVVVRPTLPIRPRFAGRGRNEQVTRPGRRPWFGVRGRFGRQHEGTVLASGVRAARYRPGRACVSNGEIVYGSWNEGEPWKVRSMSSARPTRPSPRSECRLIRSGACGKSSP